MGNCVQSSNGKELVAIIQKQKHDTIDTLTNDVLSAFPVYCTFRTKEIQQPFLHSHEGYEIYICFSGSGTFIAGERVHEVSAGSMIVVRPMALHMPRSGKGEPFHRFVFALSESYLDGLTTTDSIGRWFPQGDTDSVLWQLNPRQLLSIQDTLTLLEREISDKRDCYSLAVQSLVLQFFVNLARNETDAASLQLMNGCSKQLAQGIMGYIAQEYSRPLRIDDLCQRFHLSRSYLHRLFKRETGISVGEYLMAYRINRAKELLQSSTMPLVEVAAASGFQDLSHFCHMFKRLTGITAGRYRVAKTTY